MTLLARLKGTDASWLDDEEPPGEVRPTMDYQLLACLPAHALPTLRRWSILTMKLNVLPKQLAKLHDGKVAALASLPRLG